MDELEQSLGNGDANVAVSPSFGGKKKRVLLVEEDPLARAFLLSKLRMEGIDVDVAWNGKLALKKLPGGQLDAIFLDLLHSDIDGIELIAAARRDPEFGNRPIYVCTAGPATGNSARHRSKAGATKVFNRASNSVESIVAAVAADLLGGEPEPIAPASRQSVTPKTPTDVPPKRRQNLTWLCTHLQLLEKCKDEKARVAKCREILSKVHSVATEANEARLENMAREAAALLGFLKELCDKPQRFADSSLRTIASAVDALEILSDELPTPEDESAEFSVVIVDAELLSRTATSNALRKSGFRLSVFEDASMGLEHLRTHSVDLVVIDLPVPKLSGMDVCEKLCEASLRNRTPVILVGNRRDLKRSARILSTKGVESIIKPNRSRLALRALSLMLTVGAKARELKRSSRKSAPTAAELVVRPFVSMELSLKALSMVLKNRAKNKAADRARAAILATPQPAAPPAKTEPRRHDTPAEPVREEQSSAAVAVEEAPAEESRPDAPTSPQPEIAMQTDAAQPDQSSIAQKATDAESSTAEPPVLEGEPPVPANRGEDTSVWISVKATRDGAARQWKPADTGVQPDPDSPTESGPLPSLPDVGIVDIDAEGKIVSASDLCAAMFGWGDLVGEHIGKLLKGGLDNELGRKIDSSNQTREECVVPVTALRRDGAEFAASVILTPILQESNVSWSAVFRVVIPRDDSRRAREGETTMRTRSGTARLFRRQPDQEGASNDLGGASTAVEEARAEQKRLQEKLQELIEVRADLERRLSQETAIKEDLQQSTSRYQQELVQAKTVAEIALKALNEEADRNKAFEDRLRTLSENLKVEQAERTKRFDKEVADLRQASDELQSRLDAEKAAVAESIRRGEELEGKLRESSSEVEHIKGELEKQTAEQHRLETEWHDKLNTAAALSQKLESAWREADARNRQFEAEIAALRQLSDDLNGKLTAEQLTAAESKWRAEDLERRLGENLAELERVKAELAKAGGNAQFEQQLTSLQQKREQLSGKLQSEQEASAKSKQRSDELENRLRENNAEMERIKSDADRHAQDQARLESQLQAELSDAKRASEDAKTALERKAAECTRFEGELSTLRLATDELNRKFAAEQESVAAAKRRNDELEAKLRDNSSEMELVKSEADKHVQEQSRLQSDLRAQLTAAKAAAERAEAALKEEAARNKGFEQRLQTLGTRLNQEQANRASSTIAELSNLRQAREELHAKLTASQEITNAAKQRADELEKQLRKSVAELQEAQTKLARAQAEATSSRRTESAGQADQELSALRRLRDELTPQLATQQQAAAAAKARTEELERQIREMASNIERERTQVQSRQAERSGGEAELRQQLEAARAAAEQAQAALAQVTGELKRFEHQATNLRQERHDIYQKFVAEHEVSARATRRVAELEKRATEKTELAAKLQAQLEKAKASATEGQGEQKKKASRCTRLERELESVRKLRDELTAQLTKEREGAAEANNRIEELERRLRAHATEMSAAQNALANALAEREQLDTQHRSTSGQSDDLMRELASLREKDASRATDVSELEHRVREAVSSLSHVTAELETERGERHRAELRAKSLSEPLEELHAQLKQHLEGQRAAQARVTRLEQELRDSHENLARLTANFEKETADRKLAEEELRAVGDMSTQLRKYLTLFKGSRTAFQKSKAELDARLQACLTSLTDNESRLQKESSKRQRLEESLTEAKRSLHDLTERSSLELAKLKSDLQSEQLERKRLEAEALQFRYTSLDSTRQARTTINEFRRQMRQPVDALTQVTRHLLESELTAQQKKALESVLENALLLQASVQEAEG